MKFPFYMLWRFEFDNNFFHFTCPLFFISIYDFAPSYNSDTLKQSVEIGWIKKFKSTIEQGEIYFEGFKEWRFKEISLRDVYLKKKIITNI